MNKKQNEIFAVGLTSVSTVALMGYIFRSLHLRFGHFFRGSCANTILNTRILWAALVTFLTFMAILVIGLLCCLILQRFSGFLLSVLMTTVCIVGVPSSLLVGMLICLTPDQFGIVGGALSFFALFSVLLFKQINKLQAAFDHEYREWIKSKANHDDHSNFK